VTTDNRQLRNLALSRDAVRPAASGLPHAGGEEGLAEGHAALAAALAKKALEPILLDVRGLCSYANYILIVSGRSDRQVDAVSDGIREAMKQTASLLGCEGHGSGQWVLMDYGDLVVHVFHHPTREHYDLEGLWIDAPRIAIDVPADARLGAEDRYSSGLR
jgi:ribosome-associated protein